MVTRPRLRHSGRHRWPLGDFQSFSSAQRVVFAVTLTVIVLLLLVSGRKHSGSRSLQATGSVGRAQHLPGASHKIQFLNSQHNLKRSNLLENPSDSTGKFFKGQAVPDTAATTLGDSKPLGYYFAKDIPGHVKEKALGIRLNTSGNLPQGGKAAMGAYFNTNRSQLNNDQVSAEQINSKEALDSDLSSATLGNQYLATASNASDSEQAAEVSSESLRQHSSGELHPVKQVAHKTNDASFDQNSLRSTAARLVEGVNPSRDADEEVQKSRSSLVIAIKSAEGKLKPPPNGMSTDDNE